MARAMKGDALLVLASAPQPLASPRNGSGSGAPGDDVIGLPQTLAPSVALESLVFNLKGSFAHNFDLRDFPLDEQELPSTIYLACPPSAQRFAATRKEAGEGEEEEAGSGGAGGAGGGAGMTAAPRGRGALPDGRIDAAGDESIWQPSARIAPIDTLESSVADEFSIRGAELRVAQRESTAQDSNAGKSRPFLSVVISVRRKLGFYLLNVALPNAVITSCVFLTPAIPATDAGGRLGLASALLLTSLGFRYVTASLVPHVSYVTLNDVFAAANLFVIIGGLVVAAAVSACFDPEGGEPWRESPCRAGDRVGWSALALVWAAFLALAAAYAALRPQWFRRAARDARAAQLARERQKVG
jgi:hypothetical protein